MFSGSCYQIKLTFPEFKYQTINISDRVTTNTNTSKLSLFLLTSIIAPCVFFQIFWTYVRSEKLKMVMQGFIQAILMFSRTKNKRQPSARGKIFYHLSTRFVKTVSEWISFFKKTHTHTHKQKAKETKEASWLYILRSTVLQSQQWLNFK